MKVNGAVLLSFCVGALGIFWASSGANAQYGFGSGQDSCSLPPDPGNCYALFPSYYYDERTGRCLSFTYGGCGGNSNRFSTFRECQKLRRVCIQRG